MPTEDHHSLVPFSGSLRRRRLELDRLRRAIDRIRRDGSSACDRNPDLAAQILPLLVRLDEIREEIDRLETFPASPPRGELHPFWIRLAKRSGP